MNLSKLKQNKDRLRNRQISFFSYPAMLILVLIMMVLLITTANAQEDMKKSIQIINPRPDFALSLRLDKGAGATYLPGENIRVYFRSTRKAYVTIFSYDSYGNITLLFPNQYQKDNLVEANKQYNIEGIIDPATRPGLEYIQGFATAEQVIISRELERIIERNMFPKLEEGIARFTQRIKGILTGLPSQRWVSSEVLHYQVVRRSEDTGGLRLDSSPAGAEVYLNDRYAGKTPLDMDQISVGEYLARVELPGYQTWTKTININPNRTTFIHAELISIQRYGSIAIRCNEDNARIYLDDQYKGLTEKNRNVLLEQVREGFHDVRIVLSGYLDWLQRIEIKPNQRVQLTVNLDRIIRTGSIDIICDVGNARIYLDDKYQRSTLLNRSVTISNIREGNYELRITKEGYQDYVTLVSIYPDQTYRINVTMRPVQREGAISVNCNESNARIFINGSQKVTTTANQSKLLTGLKEGRYEVTLIKEGYHTWIDEIWVYPGETTTIYANMIRISDS